MTLPEVMNNIPTTVIPVSYLATDNSTNFLNMYGNKKKPDKN